MAGKASKNPFLSDLDIDEVRLIRRHVLDQTGERPRLREPDRDETAGRNAEPRGARRAKARKRPR